VEHSYGGQVSGIGLSRFVIRKKPSGHLDFSLTRRREKERRRPNAHKRLKPGATKQRDNATRPARRGFRPANRWRLHCLSAAMIGAENG
jgi:hypothetical protein